MEKDSPTTLALDVNGYLLRGLQNGQMDQSFRKIHRIHPFLPFYTNKPLLGHLKREIFTI